MTKIDLHPVVSPLEFIIDGVLLSIICPLGITGNIFALFILTRRQMRSSMACYLQHLAVYDTLFLICKIYLHVIPVFSGYESIGFGSHVCVIPSSLVLSIICVVRLGSVMATVGVSVERYIAICHPLKALTLCTPKRTLIFNIVIAFFATGFNIPRFFEYEDILYEDPVSNRTVLLMRVTSFGQSNFFLNVYNPMQVTVTNFIPFFSIAILNVCIYRAIRKSSNNRQEMTRTQKTNTKLGVMLLCVVVVFIVCYTPAMFYMLILSLGYTGLGNEELPHVLYLTEGINSSVNFIIYCAVGDSFKRTVRRTFCGKGFLTRSSGHGSSTVSTLSELSRKSSEGTVATISGKACDANCAV